MTQEEALTVIKQACASIVGNLEVHTKVQQAIKIIDEALKPKKS